MAKTTFTEPDESEMMNPEIRELDTKIAGCKQLLAATDYKALEYIDGAISESEYEETKKYRQHLREEINEYEDQEEEILAAETEAASEEE